MGSRQAGHRLSVSTGRSAGFFWWRRARTSLRCNVRPMSALPQKQTLLSAIAMSALCQKQAFTASLVWWKPTESSLAVRRPINNLSAPAPVGPPAMCHAAVCQIRWEIARTCAVQTTEPRPMASRVEIRWQDNQERSSRLSRQTSIPRQ